jgi:hypothetical protein
MRPDRIIVGEVRQEECLDLLMVPLVYVLDHRLPGAAGRLRGHGSGPAGRSGVRHHDRRGPGPAGTGSGGPGDAGPDPGRRTGVGQLPRWSAGARARSDRDGRGGARGHPADPRGLFGAAEPTIPVRATHVEVVDAFREAP